MGRGDGSGSGGGKGEGSGKGEGGGEGFCGGGGECCGKGFPPISMCPCVGVITNYLVQLFGHAI